MSSRGGEKNTRKLYVKITYNIRKKTDKIFLSFPRDGEDFFFAGSLFSSATSSVGFVVKARIGFE